MLPLLPFLLAAAQARLRSANCDRYASKSPGLLNDRCAAFCTAGDVASLRANCVLVDLAMNGGNTDPAPGTCFNNQVFGYSDEPSTPRMSLDGIVHSTSGPLQCQQLCQETSECVNFLYRAVKVPYSARDVGDCILKAQAHVDGALSTELNSGGYYDASYCGTGMDHMCNTAGFYDCLGCDGSKRCVWDSDNHFGGPKYCETVPDDLCDWHPTPGPPVPPVPDTTPSPPTEPPQPPTSPPEPPQPPTEPPTSPPEPPTSPPEPPQPPTEPPTSPPEPPQPPTEPPTSPPEPPQPPTEPPTSPPEPPQPPTEPPTSPPEPPQPPTEPPQPPTSPPEPPQPPTSPPEPSQPPTEAITKPEPTTEAIDNSTAAVTTAPAVASTDGTTVISPSASTLPTRPTQPPQTPAPTETTASTPVVPNNDTTVIAIGAALGTVGAAGAAVSAYLLMSGSGASATAMPQRPDVQVDADLYDKEQFANIPEELFT